MNDFPGHRGRSLPRNDKSTLKCYNISVKTHPPEDITNPFDRNLSGTFLALDPILFENKISAALVPVAGVRKTGFPVMSAGKSGTHTAGRVSLPYVRFENNQYRMWYTAADGRFLKYKAGELYKYQNSYEGMWLCCAESSDGLKWVQPELGLCEFNGSRENNILGKGGCGSFLFDPVEPDKKRRYKCVFDWFAPGIPFSVYTGTSSDGIRWNYDFTRHEHEAMECPNLFRRGKEICVMTQVFDPLAGTPDPDIRTRRVNALFVSRDFKKWRRNPGIAFQLPRQDVRRPGNGVQCHMGPAVYPAGSFGIGIYGKWQAAVSSKPEDVRTTLGLCLTDDGKHFFEPFQNFDLLGLPEDRQAWDGHMLIQPAGTSLIETDKEWLVYYTGSRGGNVWNAETGIGLAGWRRQGFAYWTTMHTASPARLETRGFLLPKEVAEMTVNASVSRESRLEIKLDCGRTFFDGAVKTGDAVRNQISWTKPVPWKALAGRKVQLFFKITGEPDSVKLYGWTFPA